MSLIDAIALAGDDGLVFELRAPDGLEHNQICLQVLSVIAQSGTRGVQRSRLCRTHGKRFSPAILTSLLQSGLIEEQICKSETSKKPTRVYRATQSGLRIVLPEPVRIPTGQ